MRVTLWHRPRRVVKWTGTLVVLLLVAGASYQACSVRQEAGRFPPPGRLVDIGGRRLHLVCIGDGEPTVVFESSGFGGALSSEAARVEISRRTRVCSYDRAGMGWSDPGPAILSAGQLVDDLERLLDRAALRPPYILVPSSIGGLTAELFARRHPDWIRGLVFLDAGTSLTLDDTLPRVNWATTQAVCLARTASWVGLIRAWDPFGLRAEGNRRAIAHLYRVEPMATLCGIVRGARQSADEFHAAPPLASDVPLTVLIAESRDKLVPRGLGFLIRSTDRARELQQTFSRQSSRGTWRVVPGSDHLIGNSQPHAVATAVLEMMSSS
jgi:pimeloyl-ACP methyl ester carboxylesterase